MVEIDRHVFHYRSTVDDTEQPYVVCAPANAPSDQKLPVVFLLHDILSQPEPGSFVEEGFRHAADWLPALMAVAPSILVQPFGRGNAGWLGLGGRDFFDVRGRLIEQFPCDPQAMSLLGIGAGATGALQLSCWFPDQFAAVAAVGAWTDARAGLPLGANCWPTWERAQREAVSPRDLVDNLSNLPVHIEHPWWFGGLAGTAGPEHFGCLQSSLDKRKIAYQAGPNGQEVCLRRECPNDRQALLEWLLAHRVADQSAAIRFKTYGLRASRCHWLQIGQLRAAGRPGWMRAEISSQGGRIKTKGIQSVALRIPEAAGRQSSWSLQVDKQPVSFLGRPGNLGGRWIHLERLAGGWQCTDAEPSREPWPFDPANAPGLVKSPAVSGPVMDLHWDAPLLVPGSLGTEAENDLMQQFAEHLRARWQSGEDSANPHPGDRSVAVSYPLRLDSAVNEGCLGQHHLVLIGTPKTNLLLARFRAHLPCRWTDDPDTGQTMSFTINDRQYDDPRDTAFFVCPNPQCCTCYLLVVTANRVSALARAASVMTAFLPDFLVHRGERVLDWGYFGPDWQAPGK